MTTPVSVQKEARVAGLREFATPTLEAIERRRWQLWILAGFLMISLSTGMVLLSGASASLQPITRVVPLYMVRVLFIGLTAGVALYLVDREARLRKITRRLIDERVLSAALSNRLKEVVLLSEAGQAVTRVLDLKETLDLILSSALDLLEAEEGSVMLVDPGGDRLVVAAAKTANERVKDAVVKFGQGIAGWVAKNREPLLIAGDPPEDMFQGFEPKERRIASAVSVPLIVGGELHAVLNVNDLSGGRQFTEYDLRALQLFAEHAAAAIRNASAFEQERRAVERLEEVDRMKTEFVATITHELRTPLTSILGAAKTIRNRRGDLTERQLLDLLEVVERQGERLLKMIEDVLSTSRIETGGVAKLRRRRLELVELAREVIKTEESAGVSNPITLDSPARIEVFADPTALEQVLTNLIDNAVKYSDSDQPISVRLIDDPGEVRIEVEDRGKGIPDSALTLIFERFRQADQSMTRGAGGVGLGLYIVKSLITAMGGDISVRSEEGRGSMFVVTLPKRRG